MKAPLQQSKIADLSSHSPYQVKVTQQHSQSIRDELQYLEEDC